MGGIAQSHPNRGRGNPVLSAYQLYGGGTESSEGDRDIDLKYSGISRIDLTKMSVEDLYKKMDRNIKANNQDFIEKYSDLANSKD